MKRFSPYFKARSWENLHLLAHVAADWATVSFQDKGRVQCFARKILCAVKNASLTPFDILEVLTRAPEQDVMNNKANNKVTVLIFIHNVERRKPDLKYIIVWYRRQ